MESNNKRIAKNTLFLYFRMILVMGVTLYTSRIVLKELGVSDYGIYSLVGGFITLFGFLNAAMSSATQRYLTFDIGKNDHLQLQKTFSATLTIHIGIAVLVLLMAETLGLWYVNHKMVFPTGRLYAVNMVYQFSIAASLLGIIQVPYNALIIARERMSIYAYVSIAEVLLKLGIVYVLVVVGSDKLIMYAVLTFVVALGIRIFYQFYCRKNFKESQYIFEINKPFYKELIAYSGWNLFGNLAAVARGQGNNLVLNFFFGTTVNAAYGIMTTVNTAVASFITNFQMASNPQIIKLYAQNDAISMQRLINRTAKFSYFLSLFLIGPIYLNIDIILKIWLVNPPAYTGILIQLILICLLIDSISGPLMTGIQATGKIKMYQLVVGILVFLNLPISYLLLKLAIVKKPETILYVWLCISLVSLILRLFFIQKAQNFDVKEFCVRVLLKIGIITALTCELGFLLSKYLKADSFISLCLQSLAYWILMAAIIYVLGFERSEKKFVFEIKKKVLQKL